MEEVEGYWIVYTYIICSDKFEIIKDKSCLFKFAEGFYFYILLYTFLGRYNIFLNEFCFNSRFTTSDTCSLTCICVQYTLHMGHIEKFGYYKEITFIIYSIFLNTYVCFYYIIIFFVYSHLLHN
mgnify:CR=1 FL=1